MRQETHWVDTSRQVPLPEKPKRVWTCIPPERRPELPCEMHHNVNGFLEDYVHDWNWRGGVLRYYSRIVESECFIVVEY